MRPKNAFVSIEEIFVCIHVKMYYNTSNDSADTGLYNKCLISITTGPCKLS